jgi:hypothetical protein
MIEVRHFWHLTQHGQGFLVIQCQILTTSGLSAAGLQSCNIFMVHFLRCKKFHRAAMAKFKQLFIEDLIRTR